MGCFSPMLLILLLPYELWHLYLDQLDIHWNHVIVEDTIYIPLREGNYLRRHVTILKLAATALADRLSKGKPEAQSNDQSRASFHLTWQRLPSKATCGVQVPKLIPSRRWRTGFPAG